MRNWSLSRKILASFVVIMATMVFMGAFAYNRLSTIEKQSIELHRKSLPALYYSTEILIQWQADYALTQKLVIQADKLSFDKVNKALQNTSRELDSLISKYDEAIGASLERVMFEPLVTLRGPYQGIQNKLLKLTAELRTSSADQGLVSAQPSANSQVQSLLRLLDSHFLNVDTAAHLLADAAKANADKAAALIFSSVTSAKTGILLCSLVALVLAVLSGFYLLRAVTKPLGSLVGVMDRMRQGDFTQRITRRDEFGALGEGFNRMAGELAGLFGEVQKSGIQVGASVTQIAATAKQQQSTATEIAATTTQIGATSKEISATSRELVKTMSDVASVAEQTSALATEGQTGLSRMEATMHHVMDAAGSINAKLAVLNEKAGNINQVVTTITKVADQTNLLSLNAAIEAEKAGEYGRGFAVVASEIRRLADQTAVATYDIEQIVREIQSAVSAGVMGMDKFSEEVRRGMEDVQQVGGQLSQIIHQVQALVPRVETANEGMQAQAVGAEQITEALLQLTDAAQQTVESLRQSTLAIDELNQVSGSLRSGVARFKLEAA